MHDFFLFSSFFGGKAEEAKVKERCVIFWFCFSSSFFEGEGRGREGQKEVRM